MEDLNGGHPVGGSPVGSQVGYWKFDEGQGRTAQDSSQYDQDLVLSTSTAWTLSGKYGKGLDLESSSSMYATTTDSAALSITGDLTISAWIKPESIGAGMTTCSLSLASGMGRMNLITWSLRDGYFACTLIRFKL